MSFALTMYEPPPDSRPYEIREARGETWRGCTSAKLSQLLESLSAYPDDDRAAIDSGGTIQRGDVVLRRRPRANEQRDAARQLGFALG